MDDLVASAATVDVTAISIGGDVVLPFSKSRLERGQTSWAQRAAMGVLDGYWTLEQLDGCTSPCNCSRCEANAWRVANRLPPLDPVPNLAREWIASHPEQWEALLRSRLADEIATPDLPTAVSEGFG